MADAAAMDSYLKSGVLLVMPRLGEYEARMPFFLSPGAPGAEGLELVPDPELDKLYPKDFAGWVAAERNGRWERVDVLNPTGSVSSPIDAQGITRKFRGINPDLPADKIAAVALDIEHHSVRELLALLHRA